MNINRGLFRLWVFCAVIFAASVFALSFDSLDKEFETSANLTTTPTGDRITDWDTMVPIECKEARGKKPIAAPGTYKDAPPLENWEKGLIPVKSNTPSPPASDSDFVIGLDDSNCWYPMPTFRALYPEYKHMTDDDLSDWLYASIGTPRIHKHPWLLLVHTLLYAFGVPVLVLILGRSLLWVASGFRK